MGAPELVLEWRETASRLQRYAPPAAQAFDDCADQLEESLRGDDDDLMTLVQAAEYGGYTADTLGRKVKSGTIKNCGQKNAPKLRRADVPTKPGYPKDPDPPKGPRSSPKVHDISRRAIQSRKPR